MHALDTDAVVVLLVAAYLSARMLGSAWQRLVSPARRQRRSAPAEPQAREVPVVRLSLRRRAK
jgi:hypothetical protein